MSVRPSFPYLDNAACLGALRSWSGLAERLGEVMAEFSAGNIRQPVRATLRFENPAGSSAMMMPCFSPSSGGLTCKLLYNLPYNSKHGLPTHCVYVLAFDSDTGAVKVVMQGEGITERRTAAASALAARHLVASPGDVARLALLGTGRQGLSHLQAMAAEFPSLRSVSVWNRTASRAKAFTEEVSGWLPNATVKACPTVAECLEGADLVVTSTSAREPIVMKSDIVREDGSAPPLVIGVGACAPHQTEIDPLLMRSSFVVSDSFEGAKVESGDVIKSGCDVKAELGQIVDKKVSKPSSPDTPVVFKSLGLAVQDLVAAQMICQQVDLEQEQGFPAPFFSREQVEEQMAKGPKGGGEFLMKSTGVEGDKIALSVSIAVLDNSAVFLARADGSGPGAAIALERETGRPRAFAEIPPKNKDEDDEIIARAVADLAEK